MKEAIYSLAFALVLLAFGGAGEAFTLGSGDILTLENGGTKFVHAIDRATGTTKGSCACTKCNTVRDLAAFGTSRIFLTASLTAGGQGIVEIDPETCSERVASSGGIFGYLRGIAVERSGAILVTDDECSGCALGPFNAVYGGVIRVNPENGAQSIVSTGIEMNGPEGIDVAPDGAIYTVARILPENYSGVVRIDPHTGVQQVVAVGGDINSGADLAIERASGPLYVLDHRYRGGSLQDEMRLIAIDLAGDPSSNQTLLTTGLEGINRDRHSCCSPMGIDVTDGLIYAIDYVFSSGSSSDYGGVIEFEPGVSEGEGVHVTDSSAFYLPEGLAIVPEPGARALEAVALAAVACMTRTRRKRSRRLALR